MATQREDNPEKQSEEIWDKINSGIDRIGRKTRTNSMLKSRQNQYTTITSKMNNPLKGED